MMGTISALYVMFPCESRARQRLQWINVTFVLQAFLSLLLCKTRSVLLIKNGATIFAHNHINRDESMKVFLTKTLHDLCQDLIGRKIKCCSQFKIFFSPFFFSKNKPSKMRLLFNCSNWLGGSELTLLRFAVHHWKIL